MEKDTSTVSPKVLVMSQQFEEKLNTNISTILDPYQAAAMTSGIMGYAMRAPTVLGYQHAIEATYVAVTTQVRRLEEMLKILYRNTSQHKKKGIEAHLKILKNLGEATALRSMNLPIEVEE